MSRLSTHAKTRQSKWRVAFESENDPFDRRAVARYNSVFGRDTGRPFVTGEREA